MSFDHTVATCITQIRYKSNMRFAIFFLTLLPTVTYLLVGLRWRGFGMKSADELEIMRVVVVHRHGDRAPISTQVLNNTEAKVSVRKRIFARSSIMVLFCFQITLNA